MQALELEAKVDDNHSIHLKLPDTWSSNRVKVIVLEENESILDTTQKRKFGQFLNQIEISDTFDDELPESFWLGKSS